MFSMEQIWGLAVNKSCNLFNDKQAGGIVSIWFCVKYWLAMELSVGNTFRKHSNFIFLLYTIGKTPCNVTWVTFEHTLILRFREGEAAWPREQSP